MFLFLFLILYYNYSLFFFFFFFFQAEDGIRDYKVTGVQTRALPIFRNGSRGESHGQRARGRAWRRVNHGGRRVAAERAAARDRAAHAPGDAPRAIRHSRRERLRRAVFQDYGRGGRDQDCDGQALSAAPTPYHTNAYKSG